MMIPHDEGFRDPKKSGARGAGDWVIGGILVVIGVLLLTRVINPGFAQVIASSWFPWLLIAIGIGGPLVIRARAR
jgi:hypothetical protein